mmetsp:Transcript_7050/g.9477  ORF Transcript_7050/g.9477 Transcript_7050/m.9477 type:complete len:159 (+) Transcript_7050:1542-2018(+)
MDNGSLHCSIREQLKRVFQLSIVQKILFRQESFGDGQWLLTLLDSAIRVHGANFYYWHQTSVVHDYQKRLNIAEKNEYRLLAEAVIFYLERISEINIEDDLRVFHKVQSFKRLFTQQNKVTTVLSRIDVQRFEEYRDELFSNITSLEGMRTYAFMILS